MRSTYHYLGQLVVVLMTLSSGLANAADEIEELRRELDAQRSRSEQQEATIQRQQEELEAQREELDRLDRKLDGLEDSSAAAATSEADGTKSDERGSRTDRDGVGDLNRQAVEVGDFPGSFKIPGPRGVSLAIGGFIRAVAIYDSNAENMGADFIPAALGTRRSDDDGAFSIDATLTRLFLDGRVPTDWGAIRGYVEWDLNNGNNGTLDTKWRHAYGTWTTKYGTLLVGQTWSTFMDLKIIPEGLTEPTVSGVIFNRQPVIRWSQPIGSSFQFHIAAEDPSSNDVFANNPNPDLFNTKYPDGVFGLEYAWPQTGHLRLNGILRNLDTRLPGSGSSSELGWGLALSGHVDVFARDRAMFSAIYGEGLGRYLLGIQSITGSRISPVDGDLQARENWGGFAAYQHHWTDTLRSTLMAGYAHATSKNDDPPSLFEKSVYSSLNLMWSPLPYLTIGVEYGYGRSESQDGSDLHNHRMALGFQIF